MFVFFCWLLGCCWLLFVVVVCCCCVLFGVSCVVVFVDVCRVLLLFGSCLALCAVSCVLFVVCHVWFVFGCCSDFVVVVCCCLLLFVGD